MLNTPPTFVSSTRLDVVVVERRERIVANDAGVVHQHVDAPGAIGKLLDSGRARRGVA